MGCVIPRRFRSHQTQALIYKYFVYIVKSGCSTDGTSRAARNTDFTSQHCDNAQRTNTASMAFQLYPPKKFRPVSQHWQFEKSKDLNLIVHSHPNYGREKLFTQTSPPKQTASVRADGNCFFRALSYVITGVEDHHMNIREAITKCVENNSDMFRTLLQSRGGMKNYVCSMRQPREWATDTEIFAAATLLKTVIEVCTPCRTKKGLEYQWQTFTPLDKPELRGPSIYISNRDSHFEPVLDVEERRH